MQQRRFITALAIVITLILVSVAVLLLGVLGHLTPLTKTVLISVSSSFGCGLILTLLMTYYLRSALGNPNTVNADLSAEFSSSPEAGPLLELDESTHDGVTPHTTFASIDMAKAINEASRLVRVFAVSGRHVFVNPRIRETILAKVENPNDSCRFEILVIDTMRGRQHVDARDGMMELSIPEHDYQADIENTRSFLKGITLRDPERKKISVRFYPLLPTTFFFIADDRLFTAFLLTHPVAACPAYEVDLVRKPELGKRFLEHFNHYWSRSKFFVSVLGFDPKSNRFLMVRSPKRHGWEWPSGYMEPGESSAETAAREFLEETGHEITHLHQVHETYSGVYYSGLVGERVGAKNDREVSEIRWFRAFPRNLSYSSDSETLLEVARLARRHFSKD